MNVDQTAFDITGSIKLIFENYFCYLV